MGDENLLAAALWPVAGNSNWLIAKMNDRDQIPNRPSHPDVAGQRWLRCSDMQPWLDSKAWAQTI